MSLTLTRQTPPHDPMEKQILPAYDVRLHPALQEVHKKEQAERGKATRLQERLREARERATSLRRGAADLHVAVSLGEKTEAEAKKAVEQLALAQAEVESLEQALQQEGAAVHETSSRLMEAQRKAAEEISAEVVPAIGEKTRRLGELLRQAAEVYQELGDLYYSVERSNAILRTMAGRENAAAQIRVPHPRVQHEELEYVPGRPLRSALARVLFEIRRLGYDV